MSFRSERLRLRVRFGETDAAGIVFYGTFLSWFDAGVSNLIRIPGVPSAQKDGKPTFVLPIVEVNAKFFAPLRVDEEIDLVSTVVKIGTTSVRVEHEAFALGGTRIAAGFEQRVHCRIVEGAFIKEPLPSVLHAHLSEGGDGPE
jgi:YbgC/YbaW family acyl-CoA thioester hydrolase